MNTADSRRAAGAGHSNGGRAVSVEPPGRGSVSVPAVKKAAFNPRSLGASLVTMGCLQRNVGVQKRKEKTSKHQFYFATDRNWLLPMYCLRCILSGIVF